MFIVVFTLNCNCIRFHVLCVFCYFPLGFNCGEAANIATPEWVRLAKDAAIRRASINYPPMVSHFQLLYDLALSSRFVFPSICNIHLSLMVPLFFNSFLCSFIFLELISNPMISKYVLFLKKL